MIDQFLFLLAGFGLSAIVFLKFAARRRPFQLFLLMAAFSLGASAQNWSSFLDSSRAINWNSAGFTIPNYSVNCSTQPSLATGSGNASANATAIQNALNSCDSTHNVVNIPAGTYYVAGFNYGSQGHQVLRGAGPNSTTIYVTSGNIQMISNPWTYGGNSDVLPPSGTNQCAWTAGYAQGATTITLSSCGSAPPLHQTLILDQINDTSDTGGVYVCDNTTSGCAVEAGPGDNEGRKTGGITRDEQQVVYTTGVTSLGSGSYSVTITPGVFFNNIRSGQQPGAWFPGFVQNDGIENLTLDYSQTSTADTDEGALLLSNCYQCWVKNIRSMYATRDHINLVQSAQDVIRDSYFYQMKDNHHASVSYTIEWTESSGILVENNIFQQQTIPIVPQNGSGSVVSYNYSIDNIYNGATGYMNAAYQNHNGGVAMNLWEGNNLSGIWSDDIHGSGSNGTFFRNMLIGWQAGANQETVPTILRALDRAFNYVGNVMGQPGYHTHYQTYATSSSATSGGSESTGIYSIGLAGMDSCSSGSVGACDTLPVSTLMRWGNYDTVTNGVKWDSTEASPAAVTYVNANFSSSYFGSLAHTLPASLYYNSTPSWWPSGKAWPPIGPDVSTGNVGTCSGTYSGAQATSSGQCTAGTLTAAWASHVVSNPAQDCYLNVMHGAPDGTGGALAFDANQCYSSSGAPSGSGPGSPTGLTAVVQ